MIKLIRHGLDVRYCGDNPNEIKKLESSLKFWVDGCEFSPNYRDHQWDGYHRFYNGKLRIFNYGLLHVVENVLQTSGVQYKIENNFTQLKTSSELNATLWAHQKRAVLKFLHTPYGSLQIPTRGGKTHIAAELIRITKPTQTLFVVDNQVLFEQAVNDLSKYLGLSRRSIGQIRGEIFDTKQITVAMIQTLQSIKYGLNRLHKRNKKKKILPSLIELKEIRKTKRNRIRELGNFMSKVDFAIVDEVHEYSSDERLTTIKLACNARAYLFLSATLEKSENVLGNMKIKSLAGPIIYKVAEQDLKDVGVLAHEDITLIMVDHNKNFNIELDEESAYSDYENEIIINNERRNNILINIIQMCRQLNIKTLVLFQRVKHAEYVQRITGDELVTGGTDLRHRMSVVRSHFSKRKAGILLATNIFNKGITLPDVEIMINAGGGLEKSNVTQKKGRTLGTTDTKKKAMTIDIVDISEYFSEHSLNRISVYEQSVGLESINVFDSADKDFYVDIRELLTNWKK